MRCASAASASRYAYELAGDDKIVSRAKSFQDVLGEHQDAVIAEEQLRALACRRPPTRASPRGC